MSAMPNCERDALVCPAILWAEAEIKRLRGWLEWMAVDNTDAQAALRGEPVRTVDG